MRKISVCSAVVHDGKEPDVHVTISTSGWTQDEARAIMQTFEVYMQNWNRRLRKHNGSRIAYKIELV